MTKITRLEMPRSLRAVLVEEFLPEILHDLNNECAVLDGAAQLLAAEARDPAKVGERARAVARASEEAARVAWMGNTIAAALGAPLKVQEREDGLEVFCGVLRSVLERRGGTLTLEGNAGAPDADPIALCWLVALARRFAEGGPVAVTLRALDPAGRAFLGSAAGGAAGEGLDADLRSAATLFGCEIAVTSGHPRWLCVGCAPPEGA